MCPKCNRFLVTKNLETNKWVCYSCQSSVCCICYTRDCRVHKTSSNPVEKRDQLVMRKVVISKNTDVQAAT